MQFYIPHLLSMYHMPGKIFQVLAHLILTTSQGEGLHPHLHTNREKGAAGPDMGVPLTHYLR